jgi:Transglycosylase SLT domain/Putative peptidoglycan binding domain
MPTLTATSDLPQRFFDELAKRYGVQGFALLQVWQSESGLRPSAHNPSGHASGLCQLMPDTALAIGWNPDDVHAAIPLTSYRSLDAFGQLVPWIERYYAPHERVCDSAELWYLATFLPAYLLRPREELVDSLVLAAKGGPLGWAYEANAVFDADRNGVITLGELGQAIARNCHGPRYVEATARLGIVLGVPAPAAPAPPVAYDLRTTSGLERALRELRGANGQPFYAGGIDGAFGPLLRGALARFQAEHSLWVDGSPNEPTRVTLAAALASAGVGA